MFVLFYRALQFYDILIAICRFEVFTILFDVMFYFCQPFGSGRRKILLITIHQKSPQCDLCQACGCTYCSQLLLFFWSVFSFGNKFYGSFCAGSYKKNLSQQRSTNGVVETACEKGLVDTWNRCMFSCLSSLLVFPA